MIVCIRELADDFKMSVYICTQDGGMYTHMDNQLMINFTRTT